MALEIILLQDHIKDFVYKVVNGIAGIKIEGKITFQNSLIDVISMTVLPLITSLWKK